MQPEKGNIVINAGIGYSPGFDGDINFFGSQDFPVGTLMQYFDGDGYFWCSTIIPNISIDYNISNCFSIGIASSYQSETVNWTPQGGPYSQAYSNDKISRFNIATRILYHLNKQNSSFDHYIGFRPGCSFWDDIPNNMVLNQYNPNGTPSNAQRGWGTFINNPHYILFNLQVLYGMRIYYGGNIGFHFEVGIGQPFLIEGGLNYRIITKNKNSK